MPRREEFHADGDIYHPFSLAVVVVVRSTDQVIVELYRYCRWGIRFVQEYESFNNMCLHELERSRGLMVFHVKQFLASGIMTSTATL